MDKKYLNNFIDNMKDAIYEVGELARINQGKVQNIGKEIEKLTGDNDNIKQQRSAKTIIDEKVQEILLLAASKLLDARAVYLDVEEDTPSKKYFSSAPASAVLVIDPIDGTLEYLLGKDLYGICVGLIEKGIALASMMYFPAKKEFYFIKNGGAYCEIDGKLQKLSAPKTKRENFLYVNSRVDDCIIDNLIKEGFKILTNENGVVNYANALKQCITGEYNVCIFHTPQIRDVLIGAMIITLSGGYMCDWKGNKIVWPNGGRIAQVLFGFNPLPKKILSCLEV